MKPLFPLIFTVLVAAAACARGAGDFNYGPRPPVPVFDPSGFLKPADFKELSVPLTGLYQREGIDVLVVILPATGGTPPEDLARRFARAWSRTELRCVVLAVPGDAASPWIVPSGNLVALIDPAQLRSAVADARRRAAAEPGEVARIQAAATEGADMVRYWMANAVNRRETLLTVSTRRRLEMETRRRRWKIVALAAAAAFLPLLAGAALVTARRRDRGPAYFPFHPSPGRLGGPHAGGNHAVVRLGADVP